MLELCHGSTTLEKGIQSTFVKIIQSLAGIVLLIVGYYFMSKLLKYKITALIGALVTIILGTYLTINSLFSLLFGFLRQQDWYKFHGLRSFTLAQITTRLRSYTQILSIVTLLFALGLGALTVGMEFTQESSKIADRSTAYDLVLVGSPCQTKQ
ncbi:hypothetical protein HU830_01980 [Lactobacillus sp. DCY120]|uniref:Uncharacterized protein n=1 Tax=Bombilactobacillus apium TaxID=2675299 RepID=A0A850R1R1_9LACO|nr:hypothetical protein [Bombilactobacillus apium]NVY95961.1 hypothetical protein [Bombilactobacillus apium]